MNSLPIGSYFKGDSIFHKCDAFTKIITLIIMIVAVIKTQGLESYLVWLIIVGLFIKASKIDIESITSSLSKT